MKRTQELFIAWLVGLLAVVAGAGTAAATPMRTATVGAPAVSGPGPLTDSGDGGSACLVPPGGAMECFSSVAALRDRSDQLRAEAKANGTMWGCPVDLFSGDWFSGSLLELWGQGYWINLADYGFDNVTVSFAGSGCSFHLADYAWGGGYWYPGYTGPWGYAGDMGWSWDWRVSSVYIA